MAFRCLGLVLGTSLLAAAEAISLPQAVDRALTDNPETSIAAARVRQAQAILAQTGAARHPHISISADYSYMDHPLYAFGTILNQQAFSPTVDFNDTPIVDNLRVGLQAGYQLYDGGLASAQANAARGGVTQAEAGQQATASHLALMTTRTWLRVYQAHQQQAAAQAMHDALQAHLATVRSLQQQGTALEADVLEIQVRLQEAEEQLIRTQGMGRLAAAALGNLLGSSEPVTIAAELPQLPIPAADQAATRAELMASQAGVESAQAQIAAAAAGKRPTLQAMGQMQADTGLELENSDPRLSWMVGLKVEWKVWDGRLSSNRVHQARAGMLMAEQQARATELRIALQRQEATVNLRNTQERVRAAEQGLSLAAKRVELVSARYAEGLATTTQIIDAESARTGARIRLAAAAAEVVAATATLRHAQGLPIIVE
jgi:outer membrane protein